MLNIISSNIDIGRINYSISIKDLKTGISYNYNENQVVSSASTIKLLIMAEIMNLVNQNVLSLKQRVTIDKVKKVPYSILTMLEDENSYSLKDIITLMIIQSDNTATNILIDLAGMNNINNYIRELGLLNTVLQRKMMDFNARNEGRDNFTTSKDMANFMELLYDKKIINENYSRLMLDILKMQLDRSMAYMYVPDEVIIAHKTGELDCIENEVGIFYTEKKDYIFSMLTWEAESNNYAREIVGKTAKIVYDYFERSPMNGRHGG